MKAVRLALLSLLCVAPVLASAQWQWLDKDGHKVFSDQSPPPDVTPDRILKQPAARGAAPSPQAAPAPAPAAVATRTAPRGVDPSLKPAGKDKTLEEKRKQMEAAESEKTRAEEAKVAALRAENCTRARASKTGLESGQRVAVLNDKGEREFLDDARRATEIKRLADVIARDCRAQDRQ